MIATKFVMNDAQKLVESFDDEEAENDDDG
jgi:hypothetical protein